MLKNYFAIVAAVAVMSMIQLSFAESGNYDVKVDENTYGVSYSFDGNVIAMDIDKEAKSLLIGTTGVDESTFDLSFPSELLSAEGDDFVILLDGIETDYSVSHEGDLTKISFTIPIVTEEIEIIGSSVIPEFPFGALAVMGMVSVAALAFSKSKTLSIK